MLILTLSFEDNDDEQSFASEDRSEDARASGANLNGPTGAAGRRKATKKRREDYLYGKALEEVDPMVKMLQDSGFIIENKGTPNERIVQWHHKCCAGQFCEDQDTPLTEDDYRCKVCGLACHRVCIQEWETEDMFICFSCGDLYTEDEQSQQHIMYQHFEKELFLRKCGVEEWHRSVLKFHGADDKSVTDLDDDGYNSSFTNNVDGFNQFPTDTDEEGDDDDDDPAFVLDSSSESEPKPKPITKKRGTNKKKVPKKRGSSKKQAPRKQAPRKQSKPKSSKANKEKPAAKRKAQSEPELEPRRKKPYTQERPKYGRSWHVLVSISTPVEISPTSKSHPYRNLTRVGSFHHFSSFFLSFFRRQGSCCRYACQTRSMESPPCEKETRKRRKKRTTCLAIEPKWHQKT